MRRKREKEGGRRKFLIRSPKSKGALGPPRYTLIPKMLQIPDKNTQKHRVIGLCIKRMKVKISFLKITLLYRLKETRKTWTRVIFPRYSGVN